MSRLCAARTFRTLGVLVLLTAALAGSCRRGHSDLEKLKLPRAPLFSGNEMWGVVRDPYLRISLSPQDPESTVMTLRQGEIASVLAIQSFDDIYWCRLKYDNREGWTLRDNLDIYESLAKAENGAALRLNPEGKAEP